MKIGYLSGMEVSASGLAAQRAVMNATAENLANLHTTRTESGEPYRRQIVTLEAQPIEQQVAKPPVTGGGLPLQRTDAAHIARPVDSSGTSKASEMGVQPKTELDASEFPTVHDPGHPDADENGMVRMPNVDLAHEMVALMAASRAYEANLAALQAARKLAESGLNLAR